MSTLSTGLRVVGVHEPAVAAAAPIQLRTQEEHDLWQSSVVKQIGEYASCGIPNIGSLFDSIAEAADRAVLELRARATTRTRITSV